MIRKTIITVVIAALVMLGIIASPLLGATMKSPRFSIAKAYAAAGAPSITYVISKTNRSSQPSSINYTTLDGTATAGLDYVAKAGTLQVPASVTKVYLKVNLLQPPDAGTGASRSFGATISAGTNAIIGTATATGTIVYDATVPPPPPPPPPVPTQTCSDGSVIPTTSTCPTPPPPGAENEFEAGVGLTNIPSNFDTSISLVVADVPGSAGTDPVGAFRFICGAGHIARADPVVNPGTVSAHIHQFFGLLSVDANSTYASLRASGPSSCEPGNAKAVNPSGYWISAMLDGVGNIVRPDFVSIYYKRRPINDPKCSLTSGDARAEGDCVPLPNGLRFIFGYDMLTATAPTGSFYFTCQGPTSAAVTSYPTIAAAAAVCPTTPSASGEYNRLGAVINAPSCWDGVNLDTANHRDHVSYGSYGSWGYYKCPPTHPKVIPGFTLGAWYRVDENLGTWRLSSDAMVPSAPGGSTFHADWFGAWDNQVQAMWMDNCINKRLNCSGGNLGSGKGINGMWGPPGWAANPRLVPVSSIP